MKADGPAATLVDLRGVKYRYPEFVLGPIDLHIAAGSRVALVGRNGAGKTTLLSLLGGYRAAADGTAWLLGKVRTEPDPSLREHVAFVPTELLGLRWMRVREHFEFLANFYNRWNADSARGLADALELDVGARLDSLSRGTSLKVALCAAWGQGAELLLLDEPTAGLDPVARIELMRQVESYLRDHPDVALVFATHILEDLDEIAFSDLLVLREGRAVSQPGPHVAAGGDGLGAAARRALLGEE